MSGIDNLFAGLRASATGLTAERVRLDVIAENIANARTTRTAEGGPYRRQIVSFEPILQKEMNGQSRTVGVRAAGVTHDLTTPFSEIVDASHPDAGPDGKVRFPNVNAVLEMADMISSMRAYEANLSAQQNFIQMAERALELAR